VRAGGGYGLRDRDGNPSVPPDSTAIRVYELRSHLPMWFDASGVLIAVAMIVLAVAALIVLVRTGGLTGIQRLVWALAIIFLPVVGPILWLVTRAIIRRGILGDPSSETNHNGA